MGGRTEQRKHVQGQKRLETQILRSLGDIREGRIARADHVDTALELEASIREFREGGGTRTFEIPTTFLEQVRKKQEAAKAKAIGKTKQRKPFNPVLPQGTKETVRIRRGRKSG